MNYRESFRKVRKLCESKIRRYQRERAHSHSMERFQEHGVQFLRHQKN